MGQFRERIGGRSRVHRSGSAGAFLLTSLFLLPGAVRCRDAPFIEHVILSRDGSTRRIAAAYPVDFDGDGDIDVLTTSSYDDKIAWFENNGGHPARFIPHVITANPDPFFGNPVGFADGASSVVPADLDGDGDLDALFTAADANMVGWFENLGGSPPTFAPHVISTSALGAAVVVAADLDGDGDVDVVAASRGDATLAWFENDGVKPPGFTAHVISASVFGVRSVVVADLDGDGHPDVVAASEDIHAVDWFKNDGALDPSFAPRPVTASAFGVQSVHAADLNHDGHLDLISASSPGLVVWYKSDGATDPTFSPNLISDTATGGKSVFAADVDHDGNLDVLAASSAKDLVVWFESSGGANPAFTRRTASTGIMGALWVSAADVDRDGKMDVLAAATDDKVVYLENLGGLPPSFRERIVTASAYGPLTVHAADINGDGKIDIAAASHLDNKVSWLENEGGFPPTFHPHTASLGAIRSESIYAADLDGDGNIDLMGASVDDFKVSWYENGGGPEPTFTEHILNTDAEHAESVWAADLDGDGDMDVLSASSIDDKVAWYENIPSKGPIFPVRIITVDPDIPLMGQEGSTDGVLTVRAADVDGDGDIDVLTASYFDAKISWFENNGARPPVFTQHVISTAGAGARSVYPADMDGDGDMDVVSASFFGENIHWHENVGGTPPQFVTHLVSASSRLANWVYVADLNLDGHPDILANSIENSSVIWFENDGGRPPNFIPHVITTTAEGAWSVYAADLDGDGDVDVISASFANNDKIVWFENRLIVRDPNAARHWELYE